MRKALYRYAVLKHPTSEEEKTGGSTVVLVPPSEFILGTEAEVQMIAARAVPESELPNAPRIEVVVSPF